MSTEQIFGSPHRYSSAAMLQAGGVGRQEESAEERMIRKLLDHHAQDLQQRVEQAVKQWNLIIRDYLQTETGLRLTVGDDQQAVPLRVTAGLPPPFAHIVGAFPSEVIWKLYINRSLLEAAGQGLKLVADNYEAILAELPRQDMAGEVEVQHSYAYMTTILRTLDQLTLINRIQNIQEDILGAYYFRMPEVHLYWMVIGLIAAMLNVPVEALTIVVLTHELAHAYTHLGRDIDGQRWDTGAFAKAELDIVEGLAQFYTKVICDRLVGRYPAAKDAYGKLLKIQSGPYLVHDQWADARDPAGEVVRFAMIDTRSRQLTTSDQFHQELKEVRQRIGRLRPRNNAATHPGRAMAQGEPSS